MKNTTTVGIIGVRVTFFMAVSFHINFTLTSIIMSLKVFFLLPKSRNGLNQTF